MDIIRLLTVELFRELQPINEDTDSTILKKVLYNAQESKIQELLGSVLYKKILSLVDSGDISEAANEKYKLLLDLHIRKVLGYWGYVDAIPHMTYQFGDKGVQERSGNHSAVASRGSVKEKQSNAINQAEFHTDLMQKFICKHARDYPEYGRIDDGVASNSSAYFCGIQLDFDGDYRDPLEQP